VTASKVVYRLLSRMLMSPEDSSTAALIGALSQLRAATLLNEERLSEQLGGIHPDYLASARNLLHYLGLRQHDIRSLQRDLAARGLSSLGRCEPHTLASIDAVLRVLGSMSKGRDPGAAGRTVLPAARPGAPVDFDSGPARLEKHTRRLLGPRPQGRAAHIMVTMPPEAAADGPLIEQLLASGMDIMRINCAHDDARAWRAMVRHLRAAEKRSGRRCRVLVDLAGPKLRTGGIVQESGSCKLKVQRDRHGTLVEVARVWLTPAHRPEPAPAGVAQTLPVVGLPRALGAIREIRITDARGSHRELDPVEVRGRSLLCESKKTVFVESGTRLAFALAHQRQHPRIGHVAALPRVPVPIHLQAGDHLVLTRASVLGRPARGEPGKAGHRPAQISCTLPEVFRDVKAGEPIWIDDGKIGGKVLSNDGRAITLVINQVPPGGAALLPDKGINLPATELHLPALTPKDLQDLRFARNADMVGLSFVQRPADVIALQARLAKGRAPAPGIVLKIETRRGFEALPMLLLAGLRSPPVGVMVARGDLAVEMGFERLAEVQEEILWMCEAAHVPVIWATQVLESLAKKGAASRAEVTDAAMGVRAECVMLNKGPFINRAVAFLADVLGRMQQHQSKKSATLRQLAIAGGPKGGAARDCGLLDLTAALGGSPDVRASASSG
jgi:pyruvate kinase